MEGARFALLAALGTGCAAEPPAIAPPGDYVVPLVRIAPQYPGSAAATHLNGCVVIAADVRPDGLSDNYEIVDSQPAGVFDDAALRAMNQWRFQPSTSGCQRIYQPFTFSTKKGSEPERECAVPSQPPGPCKGSSPAPQP
jgi:TonB family protein